MTNLEIQVNAVEPFAEGQTFGEAGPYLRIRGVAKGELDLAAPENRSLSTSTRRRGTHGASSNTRPISS